MIKHLIETSSIPLTDIQACASSTQVTYMVDMVAQKLVSRLGQQIINHGFVLSEENVQDQRIDLTASIHVIPLEYGNDVLRFAQDVIKAHEEQEALQATS